MAKSIVLDMVNRSVHEFESEETFQNAVNAIEEADEYEDPIGELLVQVQSVVRSVLNYHGLSMAWSEKRDVVAPDGALDLEERITEEYFG